MSHSRASNMWCNCLVNVCLHTQWLCPTTKMTESTMSDTPAEIQSLLISMPLCNTSDLTEAGASLMECSEVSRGQIEHAVNPKNGRNVRTVEVGFHGWRRYRFGAFRLYYA